MSWYRDSYRSQGTLAGSTDTTSGKTSVRYKRPTEGWWNQAVTYTASCPEGQQGHSVTMTIPAGSLFSSLGQEDANEQAWELAKAAAYEQLVCYLTAYVTYVVSRENIHFLNGSEMTMVNN